jgi:hypothetical protein
MRNMLNCKIEDDKKNVGTLTVKTSPLFKTICLFCGINGMV